MLNELIQTSDRRKEFELNIQKKRADFEESISLEKAQYEDLLEKERILREEALLKLEAENKTSEKVGDRLVIKQIKQTLKIVDPLILSRCIINNVKVEEYGFNVKEINEAFEPAVTITNKPLINNFIDAYEKVEGKLLKGIEKQETKFILIK